MERINRILTTDIHTTVSTKHVEGAVDTQEKSYMRVFGEVRNGICTYCLLIARLTT